MKKWIVIALFCGMFSPVLAQEALWSNQQIVSPELNPDQTVTFRIHLPQGKLVQVTGDFLPSQKQTTPFGETDGPGVADLVKGENGIWEYTSAPLAPELYSYSFIVDGFKTTDPNNVYLIRDVASITNVFLVGGGQADLYQVNDVPHGTLTHRWYESPGLKMNRRMSIYTPPGYEDSKESYPVFYLLHGMGGDEEAWLSLGRSTQIMDNLIAKGEAKPMIVVMTNGNAAQEAAPGESSLGLVKPTMQLPKTMEGSMEASFPDVVHFIDQQYRTIPSKDGRAIAGLSMGGYHALHISKEYPDLFNYVGLFSAAIIPNKDAKSPIYDRMEEKLQVQFQKKPKLYWIAIGKTDFLYKANEEYRHLLDEKGYPYVYVESEGGHIWRNWRIYLTDFVPQLF